MELGQRGVTASPWAKAMAFRSEFALENWFKDGFDHQLNQSVYQRRNTERALLPVRFRDIHPAHWLVVVRSGFELASEFRDDVLAVRLGGSFVHSVDASRARANVCHELVEGPFHQWLPSEQVVQFREPMFGFVGRLLRQPPLEFGDLHPTRFRRHIHMNLLMTTLAVKPAALRHVPGFPRLGLLRRLRQRGSMEAAYLPNPCG